MADVDEALIVLRNTIGTGDVDSAAYDIVNVMRAWRVLDSSITELNEFPEEWDDSNRYA